MSVFSAIVLGFVQGLTEFLPVSSSGHLILAREFFQWNVAEALGVDAILQLATILAVLVYFHKDLWRLFVSGIRIILRKPVSETDKTLLWAIVLGTIPAVFLGLLLEKLMETAFRTASLVAGMLILGSVLFWTAEKYATQNKHLTLKKGFLVGLFQSLALVPGISRSGATISGGLLLGLNREEATLFSFLLSFPIILGSGLKKLLDLRSEHMLSSFGWPLLLSFAVSFGVGLLAIHFLIKYLKTHSLNIFIFYRVALAILVLAAVWVFWPTKISFLE